MADHTPEPWQLSEAGLAVFGPGEDPWCIVLLPVYDSGQLDRGEGVPDEVQRANARRLRAAVNACAGLPTEALEQIPPGLLGEAAAYAVLGPTRGVCSWCDLELFGDADPKQRMRRHQAECPKHPMRAVERQRDDLLEAALYFTRLGFDPQEGFRRLRAAIITAIGEEAYLAGGGLDISKKGG